MIYIRSITRTRLVTDRRRSRARAFGRRARSVRPTRTKKPEKEKNSKKKKKTVFLTGDGGKKQKKTKRISVHAILSPPPFNGSMTFLALRCDN